MNENNEVFHVEYDQNEGLIVEPRLITGIEGEVNFVSIGSDRAYICTKENKIYEHYPSTNTLNPEPF